jgi:carboxypeptidase family protein
MMKKYLLLMIGILLSLTTGLPCWGQSDVTGTVEDQNGVLMSDTVIEASDAITLQTKSTSVTNANGEYGLYGLLQGKYILTVWASGYQTQTTSITVGDDDIADQNFILSPGKGGGEFYRFVLGLQQTGASSTPSVRKFFADLYFEAPVRTLGKGQADPVYGPRLRVWGDVRASSVPEASPVQLSQFNLTSQVTKLNTSQIVQSMEFGVGPEFRIFGHPPADQPPYVGQNDNVNDILNLGRFTGSLFLEYGATTPLNPQQSATLVDGLKGDAGTLYKDLTASALPCLAATPPPTTCTIAIVSKDTSQFEGQWYAGLRLKTHYFTPAGIPEGRPPAVLDVAVGQNEAVTEDRLHGMVFRLNGFYPLPFEQLKMIYLFGRGDIQISARPLISNPYILVPAASTVSITDSGVIKLVLPFPRRDTYQIGIGVDMIPLLSKLIKPVGQ